MIFFVKTETLWDTLILLYAQAAVLGGGDATESIYCKVIFE